MWLVRVHTICRVWAARSMAVMGCGRLGGVVLSPKMVRCWMGLLAGVGAAGLGRRSNFVATAGVLTPINGWWLGGLEEDGA